MRIILDFIAENINYQIFDSICSIPIFPRLNELVEFRDTLYKVNEVKWKIEGSENSFCDKVTISVNLIPNDDE